MAEALGLASSIVALVQLSASVYAVTSKFYRDAKDANSKIKALATQIRDLAGVLQSLSMLTSAPLFDDAGAPIPEFRNTCIGSCHNTLQKIKKKLEKACGDIESGSHRKLVTRSLKWPFAAQETNDLIAELGRHRDSLQLALSADTMSQLLQCLANTKSIAESIERIDRKLERKLSIDMRAELTKKREDIVQFFLKVNPQDYFQDCLSRRQSDTGKWLIERDETFRAWFNSPGSQIWLSGIPGAGKTILCGTVVEEILQKQSTSTAVAFFFCDYKSTQSQQPVNVLGAVAVQLAKQADAAFALLESYYEELHPQNGITKQPETKGMIKVIQAIIRAYDAVYLAIDGLDECGSEAVKVIHSLQELANSDQVTMALFSRNEPDIACELSDCLSIEIAAHTEDLELYVLSQMENRKRLGSLAVRNADLHEHIQHTLIQGANGMFRWVACQLDYLDGLPSDKRRREALKELPPTLFETYDRVLDRILQEDDHGQELARKSLHWIGLGYKFMSPQALCEAISIPDAEDMIDKELLVDTEWILRSCSSLIRLAGQDSGPAHFELAHFTVKEYLRSIKPQSHRSLFQFSEDQAIESLLQTSLRFLTFQNFDQAPVIASSEIQRMAQRNEQHPFYPVAAGYTFCSGGEYWKVDQDLGDRLTKMLDDERMMNYAAKLFDPEKSGLFLSWILQIMWYWPETIIHEAHFAGVIGLLVAPGFSTLHVAASLALPSICRYLIKKRHVNINDRCRLGTPLHALLGGVSIFQPRSMTQFDYDKYRHRRSYPLTKVRAYDQCKQCLELFVQNAADTSARWGTTGVLEMAVNNATDSAALWMMPLLNPSTALDEAHIGNMAVALASGRVDRSFADAILALGSSADVPPMWARLASHIQISRMEEKGHEGGTIPAGLQERMSDEDFLDALRIALDQSLTDALESLVQDSRFQADSYIPSWYRAEPVSILHFATRKESVKVIEILLKAGCDSKVINRDGWTTLHQSAWCNTNDAAIAVRLLESGVKDSIKCKIGETCWHLAAERGNIPVLNALIELGSDTRMSLRIASKEGRAPLASAILNDEVEAALLLLDHCNEEPEVFQSDESLLDKAVAIGSDVLFLRLHEKMKQARSRDALRGFKPLDKINLKCLPKLVDYLLTTWATDSKSRSHALVNYLLDLNKSDLLFDYPERADLAHIIIQLLPSVGVVDDQDSPHDFWELFCQKVVFNFTKTCKHAYHQCGSGLVEIIFEILIEAGVLESYEQNSHLPSYSALFQCLLDRGEDLKCSWILPSIQRTVEASALSKDLANDAAGSKLLSLAVRQSTIDLVRYLLEKGISVHSSCGPSSPVEIACYSSDFATFDVVIRHVDTSRINRTESQGKNLLHWAVSGCDPWPLAKTRRLLNLGADIDSKVNDPRADTALTLASRFDREEIVALLVSEGAQPMHRGRDGWTVLHAAAITGDLRYIKSLQHLQVPQSFWQCTCDIRLMRERNRNRRHLVQDVAAVHLAAINGRSNLLRFMTQHHLVLDVNAVTGYPNDTPLHLASWYGRVDTVEFLVAANADVNARNAYGHLPVDRAADGGHIGIVKALLKAGSEPPSKSSKISISHLMSKDTECGEDDVDSKAMDGFLFEQAISNGKLDRCKDLVKRGQYINAKLPSHSYTPLLRAVVEGQTAIVDWLISSGVEVRTPVIDRLHPLMRCVVSLATHHIPSPQTLSAIMSLSLTQSVSWYESILGPLHVAVLDNKMKALKAILKHIRENDHMYRRMIETELICVPDNIINWRGRTALSILVSSFNHEEAFSRGSPWTQSPPPGSPLHWAIRYSNVTAVGLLLEHEADVKQVDSLGKTPLQLAVLSEDPATLVQELVQAGAGLAEPSRSRIDAMQSAIRNGDLELVKTLAEADPETLEGLDQGRANSMLEDSGSTAVFQYLLSRGADPFNLMEDGNSAITWLVGDKSWSCLTGFILNSGLVAQSSKKSLALAFGSLASAGGPESTRRAKMLSRALPNGVFTSIVNLASRNEGSPLCLAASVSAAGMVEALITRGTELDLEGCRYGSPLMAACAWGNLDAARVLVRAGALLYYVNGEGLLRSAISAAFRHQKVIKWLLVGRYTEQPKIDYQPSQTVPDESVWSGPRLFELAIPAYMHRDLDESRWSHLQRLQRWREELRGSALADSRRDSGLDFYAESEAESRIKAAEAAHQSFLMKLGEA